MRGAKDTVWMQGVPVGVCMGKHGGDSGRARC